MKTSPYGAMVPEGARKQADAIKAAMLKDEFEIFKGEIKDNTGKVVIAQGRRDEADGRGPGRHELPGRRRDRQGLILDVSLCGARESLCFIVPMVVNLRLAVAFDSVGVAHAGAGRQPCCCSVAFVWLGGALSPTETWLLLFKGAFGDAFSWQNTLAARGAA